MALPVGTEAEDSEGDYLRRDALGWTYRPAGLPVLPVDVVTPKMLSQYMPMVVTTATVSTTPQLDDPELREKVAIYLAQEAVPGDFMGSATDILALVKEHTK